MNQRETLAEFLERMSRDVHPDQRAQASSVLEVELCTGCAQCGRRMLEAGDYVRRDVTVLSVLDESTDDLLAKYAMCGECARHLVRP